MNALLILKVPLRNVSKVVWMTKQHFLHLGQNHLVVSRGMVRWTGSLSHTNIVVAWAGFGSSKVIWVEGQDQLCSIGVGWDVL